MFEVETGMTLVSEHPIIGQRCWLCETAFQSGDKVRFVIVGGLQEHPEISGQQIAPARAAHVRGTCAGTMRLRCACCLHTEHFEDLADAYAAGWDEPDTLGEIPVSCPLCPSLASTGLVDHSCAHERWAQEGRPATLSLSAQAGDWPGVEPALPTLTMDELL